MNKREIILTFSFGSLLIDFKGLITRKILNILTICFTVGDAFLSALKNKNETI